MTTRKPFVVYMLACRDGSYYVGITSDLQRRLDEHHRGDGCRYTRRRRPLELVHEETFATREEAAARERQIKQWRHDRKEAFLRAAKTLRRPQESASP
jgi:predicted GIY-YIG superfamily endonuclease